MYNKRVAFVLAKEDSSLTSYLGRRMHAINKDTSITYIVVVHSQAKNKHGRNQTHTTSAEKINK